LSNLHLRPIWLLGVGFAMNLLVILPHGGYMPITAEAYEASGQARPGDVLTEGTKLSRAKDIVLPRERTCLWPVTDVLPVREPRIFRGVYSPGDLVIAAGAALLIAGAAAQEPTIRLVKFAGRTS